MREKDLFKYFIFFKKNKTDLLKLETIYSQNHRMAEVERESAEWVLFNVIISMM